jgi:hypothetical protein
MDSLISDLAGNHNHNLNQASNYQQAPASNLNLQISFGNFLPNGFNCSEKYLQMKSNRYTNQNYYFTNAHEYQFYYSSSRKLSIDKSILILGINESGINKFEKAIWLENIVKSILSFLELNRYIAIKVESYLAHSSIILVELDSIETKFKALCKAKALGYSYVADPRWFIHQRDFFFHLSKYLY